MKLPLSCELNFIFCNKQATCIHVRYDKSLVSKENISITSKKSHIFMFILFHLYTCCPYLMAKYFDADISRLKKCFDLRWFSNCTRSIFNSRTCAEKVDREMQHSVWLTRSLRYWNELWRKFPIFQMSSIKTEKVFLYCECTSNSFWNRV